MHWNIEQILWAFVLAAHLVLLIVLMGRDRIKRFPWFTASIILSAVRLIADHLLNGKLTGIAFYWQSYSTLLLGSIIGVLVLIELARRVFSSGKEGVILNAKGWLGWAFITIAIAGTASWFWGPWPAWQQIQSQPAGLYLTLLGLVGTRSVVFSSLLTIEVTLLLMIFGKRFGSGWRSHPWQIAVGLSTYSIGYLTVDRIQTFFIDAFKATMRTPGHRVTQQEYDHTLHLLTRLGNVVLTLWFLVLIWWIICLWRDDPGAPTNVAADGEPVLAGPMPPLQAELAEGDQDGDPDFRD